VRTITTTFFSLGEPGLSRALLGSIVLHGILLLGFLQIELDVAPTDTSPSVIYADLLYLRDDGTGAGGRVPEAEAIGAEPEPAERPDSETPVPRLMPAPPPAIAETLPVAPSPAPALPELPAVASLPPAAPAAPAPESLAESAMPPAPPPMPIEIPAPLVEASLVRERTRTPAYAQHDVAAPALAEIPEPERRMLDRKLEQWSTRFDALDDDGVLSWQHDDRSYSATFTRVADADGMGLDHVVVAITTEQDGNRWATAMRMKRMAFSSFAQFVDRWDPTVQIHDDQIDGRFHSNSEILIANSEGVQPAFLGKVTTARSIKTTSSPRPVRRSEVFLGGLETGVRRIALPRRFLPFPADGEVEPERIRRLDRESRIVFHADGGVVWQAVDADGFPERIELPDDPFYLVAADDVALHVSGIVRGRVLVHTPDDIVIEGDLLYATDPSDAPDSTDFVGLVAGRNVVIADPETTGPGDLTVQAAIYAKRRFHVRAYGSDGPATLRIFGSVAAGALSATEPRYRTQLEFDPRLEDARPPGFPMTDSYELVAWDGLWSTAAEPGEPGDFAPTAVTNR
jgi:hypothetical protein